MTFKMRKYIEQARENVSTYTIEGNEPFIDLHELLAVIVGSRAKSESCLKLASQELKDLMGFSVYEFEQAGLTYNEALRLYSSFLLAKRLMKTNNEDKYTIRSPEDGADYLMEEMRHLQQEHFVALFLNTKNEIIRKKTIFIGSLNASIVHPREVFKEALKYSSASILVAHNHPSGNPQQSQEDIHVTKRLVEAGKMIGIEVLDHLIIGDRKFTSLKEKGYI